MSKRKRRRLVAAGILLGFALVIAAVWAKYLQSLPAQYLGSPTLALLQNVQSVQMFRLRSDVRETSEERIQIADYPLLYEGRSQGPAFSERIADVLRDPRLYWGLNDLTCIPDPGVAFRLWNGKQSIEVLLCFHCGQMLVTTKDAGGRVTHKTYTEFLSVRPRLVALAKEAFPADVEIQALK
jgi:hypothetical protein